MGAKSLAAQDFEGAKQGVLGGPVALAVLQVDGEQASLDASLQEPDAELSPELSTGTLDGAQSLSKPETQPVGTGEASVSDENRAALEVARELAVEEDRNKAEAKVAAQPKPKEAGPYFIQPASGKNWGVRHGKNAVDIANSCGTPVLAAQSGKVIGIAGGWNGGYGNNVSIQHSNGSKTRYAHLSKISVKAGQSVVQGQRIGSIGNTGRVEGRTGCHLHFEVVGASNPFVRR